MCLHIKQSMQIQALFSDEMVTSSDYLAQLVSLNFTFQCNLLSQGHILEGSLYSGVVPVSDVIREAGDGVRNGIFCSFDGSRSQTIKLSPGRPIFRLQICWLS